MEEIKFRAWDKRNNKWFHPDLIILTNAAFYPDYTEFEKGDSLFDYEYELMQYTGLKDENGKKIYEGDILQDKELPEVKIQVQYNDQKGMFEDKIDGFSLWESMKNYDFEVIGNIYENPELLEVAE